MIVPKDDILTANHQAAPLQYIIGIPGMSPNVRPKGADERITGTFVAAGCVGDLGLGLVRWNIRRSQTKNTIHSAVDYLQGYSLNGIDERHVTELTYRIVLGWLKALVRNKLGVIVLRLTGTEAIDEHILRSANVSKIFEMERDVRNAIGMEIIVLTGRQFPQAATKEAPERNKN